MIFRQFGEISQTIVTKGNLAQGTRLNYHQKFRIAWQSAATTRNYDPSFMIGTS